jgi:hypothetical protein
MEEMAGHTTMLWLSITVDRVVRQLSILVQGIDLTSNLGEIPTVVIRKSEDRIIHEGKTMGVGNR